MQVMSVSPGQDRKRNEIVKFGLLFLKAAEEALNVLHRMRPLPS